MIESTNHKRNDEAGEQQETWQRMQVIADLVEQHPRTGEIFTLFRRKRTHCPLQVWSEESEYRAFEEQHCSAFHQVEPALEAIEPRRHRSAPVFKIGDAPAQIGISTRQRLHGSQHALGNAAKQTHIAAQGLRNGDLAAEPVADAVETVPYSVKPGVNTPRQVGDRILDALKSMFDLVHSMGILTHAR